MDGREAWGAAVYGVAKRQTKQLSWTDPDLHMSGRVIPVEPITLCPSLSECGLMKEWTQDPSWADQKPPLGFFLMKLEVGSSVSLWYEI